MPWWVNEWVPVLQMLLNAGALIGGSVIWKFYVANLKAVSAAKDATIETVKTSRDHWREKAQELDKRSPEVMERLLADRIEIRDAELARLAADTETHQTEIAVLQREKRTLENDMVRARGFRLMLALEDAADEEYEKKHPVSEAPSVSPEIEAMLFPKPEDVVVEVKSPVLV